MMKTGSYRMHLVNRTEADHVALMHLHLRFLLAGLGIQATLVSTTVPEEENMPPTPWQTEISAPSTCAGLVPRI